MNGNFLIAAILLGVMLAVCISHFTQLQSLSDDKWAFASMASFVCFSMILARIIERKR